MHKSKIPSATLKPRPDKRILQNSHAPPEAVVDFRTFTVSLVDSRTPLVSLGVSLLRSRSLSSTFVVWKISLAYLIMKLM